MVGGWGGLVGGLQRSCWGGNKCGEVGKRGSWEVGKCKRGGKWEKGKKGSGKGVK